MKFLFLILAFFLITNGVSAQTYTCEQVREFVATHGRKQAELIAIQHGITKQQLKQARRCLDKRK